MENDDKYLPQLLAEKDSLDSSFTHAMKLLNAGKEVFQCVVLCCVVLCRMRGGGLSVKRGSTPARERTSASSHTSTRSARHVFADGTFAAPSERGADTKVRFGGSVVAACDRLPPGKCAGAHYVTAND